MASLPQISKTLNSKGVTDILNHERNTPNKRIRQFKSEVDERDIDEEDKRPVSNASSGITRQITNQNKPMERDDDEMSIRSTASRHSESRVSAAPIKPIKYPPSIQAADRRAQKVTGSLDGKAFLMDIDNKFDDQDKVLTTMMNQLNSLQVKLDSVTRTQKMLQDNERDARMKLEGELRINSDQSNFSLSELIGKITSLEDKLKKEQITKIEMSDKLAIAEENQRELMEFMSQSKKQDENELKQLRSMLHDIHSEEQMDKSKNNEKSAAMFQEVVRIGVEQEKMIENLQNINSSLEQHISALEGKISMLENNTANYESKGEVSNSLMGELAEKTERRLHNLEDVIQILTSDHNFTKTTSSKNAKELREKLEYVQKESDSKLETRMSEIVNKLLDERDERIRKSKFEREEMRSRYAAMDAMTKAEFQRHNEAILGIQNNLEAQMKTVSSWIKQEELNRTQLEVNLRMEVAKITEQTRGEQEAFQKQQVQINEKITDMIRMETDARERNEDDKKALIQNLIRGVTEEVIGIKEDTDAEIRKLTQEVKDIASDNSERSHFLSRYIDDEIYKVSEKMAKPIENLKMLSTRLTEQFKKHLINHENIKKDIYKRFSYLKDVEARMLLKMKELKDTINENLVKNFKIIDTRMDQFSELVDTNLNTLRRAIQDNREMLTTMRDRFIKEISKMHISIVADFESLSKEMTYTQTKLQEVDIKRADDKDRTEKALMDIEVFINSSVSSEKAARIAMAMQLAEDLDKVTKDYLTRFDSINKSAAKMSKTVEK